MVEKNIVSLKTKKKKRSDVFLYLNTVIITDVKDHYQKEHNASNHLIAKPVYRVLTAHFPNNDEIIYIYSDEFSIRSGIHFLSLKLLNEDWLKDNAEFYLSYVESGKEVHKMIPSVEIRKYFYGKKNWKKELHDFLYRKIEKDSRLIDVAKTFIVPLDFDTNLQAFNNHTIQFTKTSTGKSKMAEILGEIPITRPTEAGLIGGIDKSGRITTGVLSGTGFRVIDEITVQHEGDIETLKHALNMAENGIVERGLVTKVRCEGTVCMVICGNPKFSDEFLLPLSFRHFVDTVCGDEAIERIGKRFGLLIFGTDYKQIIDVEYASSNRYDKTLQVIKSSCLEHKDKIDKVIRYFLSLPERDMGIEYRKKVMEFAAGCSDNTIRRFLEGMSMSFRRLRCGAIKKSILENLDKMSLPFKKLIEVLVPEINHSIQRLMEINLDSMGKIVKYDFKDINKGEYFACLEKYPGLKEISRSERARIFKVSESCLRQWEGIGVYNG